MYSLVLLIVVFTEAFPAPPILLYTYYSCLTFAMHGVTMLRDVPKQFFECGVFKNFCQKFGQVCETMVSVAL